VNFADLFRDDPHPHAVPQGRTILHEGAAGEVMYVVLEGYVEITMRGQLLDVVGPGGSFGEMALVDNSPRSATACARTDARLAVVDRERFHRLVQTSPEFALAIMKTLAHRLRREMQLHAP
jgi:CRP/FNR family cyclic AMP-dependent transcriptional regulator